MCLAIESVEQSNNIFNVLYIISEAISDYVNMNEINRLEQYYFLAGILISFPLLLKVVERFLFAFSNELFTENEKSEKTFLLVAVILAGAFLGWGVSLCGFKVLDRNWLLIVGITIIILVILSAVMTIVYIIKHRKLEKGNIDKVIFFNKRYGFNTGEIYLPIQEIVLLIPNIFVGFTIFQYLFSKWNSIYKSIDIFFFYIIVVVLVYFTVFFNSVVLGDFRLKNAYSIYYKVSLNNDYLFEGNAFIGLYLGRGMDGMSMYKFLYKIEDISDESAKVFLKNIYINDQYILKKEQIFDYKKLEVFAEKDKRVDDSRRLEQIISNVAQNQLKIINEMKYENKKIMKYVNENNNVQKQNVEVFIKELKNIKRDKKLHIFVRRKR